MKVKKNNFTENEISKALKIYNYFIENSFSNFEEKKSKKLLLYLLMIFSVMTIINSGSRAILATLIIYFFAFFLKNDKDFHYFCSMPSIRWTIFVTRPC